MLEANWTLKLSGHFDSKLSTFETSFSLSQVPPNNFNKRNVCCNNNIMVVLCTSRTTLKYGKLSNKKMKEYRKRNETDNFSLHMIR